jgi:hypothetical protein
LIHAGYTDGEDVVKDAKFERQWYNKHIANDIISHLADYSSSVLFLAFSPIRDGIRLNDIATADENSHIWPRYYYAKGTTTVPHRKGQHVVTFTAVPVKREDSYSCHPSSLLGSVLRQTVGMRN